MGHLKGSHAAVGATGSRSLGGRRRRSGSREESGSWVVHVPSGRAGEALCRTGDEFRQKYELGGLKNHVSGNERAQPKSDPVRLLLGERFVLSRKTQPVVDVKLPRPHVALASACSGNRSTFNLTTGNQGHESGPSCKPDSALSRHPSPGDSRASPRGSCAYQPDAWRPGNLACSHRWFTWPVPPACASGCRRWALTPPFHPSPVSGGIPTPSAGLLSVALDVAEGLRPSAPRLVGPSGLCYESGLCSTFRAETLRRSDGSDGPDRGDYTSGADSELLAFPRRRRTILVGVRRSSTLSVPFQRFCQRGSEPTSGSNHTPGPVGSSTPS